MIDAIVTETDALKSSRSDQSPFQPHHHLSLSIIHGTALTQHVRTIEKYLYALGN